jgi:hypothetical protein
MKNAEGRSKAAGPLRKSRSAGDIAPDLKH